MTFQIDSLTLPVDPKQARMSHSTVEQEEPMPGALPLLISIGRKSDKLTIEGWLFVQGQNKAYLETTYIDVIEGKTGTQVTIAADDDRYDGDWILSKFDYEEGIHRGSVAFYYEIVFKKGSTMVVLS